MYNSGKPGKDSDNFLGQGRPGIVSRLFVYVQKKDTFPKKLKFEKLKK